MREPGKSDPIEATAIARAALREGIDTLPVAFLDEQAHEIWILTDYRDQLVNERVRHINRLRWHLVQIAPELEAQIRPAGLEGPRIRARLTRQLAAAAPQSAASRREGDPQADLRDLPGGAGAARRAQDADRGSLPAAARRARLRPGHRRDHHRPHRRCQAVPDRVLRASRRHRPDPCQLWQHQTPPTAPRRRPPTQPRAPHHRAVPRPHRPGYPRLPRPPPRRRQDQEGSDPLSQAPPRAPHLAPSLHGRTHTSRTSQQTARSGRRRRTSRHALRPLNPANSETPLTRRGSVRATQPVTRGR